MATFTKDQLLKAIDSRVIYEKEYDIITKLLEYNDNETFCKILEEVLSGNLYWYDFREFLSNTNYPTVLSERLELQNNMKKYISKLIALRKRFNSEYEFTNQDSMTVLTSLASDSGLTDKFYTTEYERIRDNILYKLTQISSNDSTLTIAYKIKLYNMIMNGQVLIKEMKSENVSSVDELSEINISSNNTISVDGIEYDYIDPDDIFFFMNTNIIPIEYQFQDLDDFDRLYMSQNNISEDTMKQVKSLSYLINKDIFLGRRTDGKL